MFINNINRTGKIISSPIEIIINTASGANDKDEIRQKLIEFFDAKRVEVRIVLVRTGAELISAAKAAASGKSQTIVAGGGDGTLATVAAELVGTDKKFGVLPLGTFNYFAKNLGIPLEPEAAARIIIEGRTTSVDVGSVNGRTFLINASLGLHPEVLREREKIYRRWGRNQLAALFSYIKTLLRPASFLRLRLTTANGEQILRKTPLVFVGFNKFQLDEINIRGSDCLDVGKMPFYISKPMSRIGLLRLAARGFFGGLRDSEDFQVLCLKEARVEARRKHLSVSMDGEVLTMRIPIHFRIHPKALRVIVPFENKQ